MNPKRIGSILSVAALTLAVAASGAVFACEKHADSAEKIAADGGCAKKAEAQVAVNGAADAKPCAKVAEGSGCAKAKAAQVAANGAVDAKAAEGSGCCAKAKAKAAQVAKADAEPAKAEAVARSGDR